MSIVERLFGRKKEQPQTLYEAEVPRHKWVWDESDRENADSRRAKAARVLKSFLGKPRSVTVHLVRDRDRGYGRSPERVKGSVRGKIEGFEDKFGRLTKNPKKARWLDVVVTDLRNVDGAATFHFDHHQYGGDERSSRGRDLDLANITKIEG